MIDIRVATINDLTMLEQVGDVLFDNPVNPERAREFLQNERHYLVIAVDDNAVVGMASGITHLHPDKDPTLFINDVAVLEEFRNQGVGRALTKALLSEGKRTGCVDFWLATEASNLPARKAYKAAGGREDAEHAVVITFREKSISV